MLEEKSFGWRPHAIWAAAATFCAFAQFRMIMLVLGNGYSGSIEAALGVVKGYPHWKIYQSRILGPWLINILSWGLGSYGVAHIVFTILLTAIAGWLVLYLVSKRYGRDAAWASFFFFELLFSLLLGKLWLYAWDSIGIIAFILFMSFVWSGKGWQWFTALFAVALLNHESAMYIALWMIADPLVKARFDRKPIQWKLLASGVFCLLGGELVIATLRSVLLVHEVGPDLFKMPEKAGKDIHIQWTVNSDFLWQTFTKADLLFNVLVPLFLVGILVLAALLALRDPRRWLALAGVQLVVVVSLLAVSVLSETRVMLNLVPFLCMGIQILLHEPKADRPLKPA